MSIDDLARVAHMSKFHFARVFRQRTGVPPMNYVYQQRAEAARHLLVTTKRTIESIAYDTGFASENHLSRHIHHTFGLPPATLRRNAGKYSSAKLLDQNNVTQQ
jgi:AraC family transcriptional regulator